MLSKASHVFAAAGMPCLGGSYVELPDLFLNEVIIHLRQLITDNNCEMFYSLVCAQHPTWVGLGWSG